MIVSLCLGLIERRPSVLTAAVYPEQRPRHEPEYFTCKLSGVLEKIAMNNSLNASVQVHESRVICRGQCLARAVTQLWAQAANKGSPGILVLGQILQLSPCMASFLRVCLQVWNQNGRTPYITYEYTVLRDSLPPVPPPPVYTGSDTSAGEVSVEVGGMLAPNSSVYDQTAPDGQLEPGGPDGQKGQETNEVYEETAAIDCDQDGVAAPKFTDGNGNHTGSTAHPAPAGGPLDAGPDSPNLIWRVLLDGRIGPDELLINISTNQLLTEGDSLFSSEVGPVELDLSSLERDGLNETLEFTLGRKRNDSGDAPFLNKTVQSGGRTSSRSNRTRGNQRQKNLKMSAADMYRWKLSSQEPCSMTCSIGVSKSFVSCVRYDGIEVHDMYCDALTRPEPVHDFCIGRECQPRWEASSWSECSRTCGEGFQFRQVRCWKMLSPGLDSSVYSDLCTMTDLERPMERRACKSPACGPQWEVAEWTE
ncbi:ADAMTS-like protein 2, partial [Scomber scombrus]|uniref:ADAMTS-like protein 2 n=1 Tax=Scomber scombrus TaxID=13677 RepID=UPI002DDAE25D